MAEYHSIVRIHYSLLILSTFDGHLDCYQFGAVMNEVAMNKFVKDFLWMCAFIFLR